MRFFGGAFHAVGATEYHKYEECDVGAEITDEDRVRGEGGLPLCRVCERIHDQHQRDADRFPTFGR